MKQFLLKLIVSISFLMTAYANAGLISGPQKTDGGKIVNLSGQSWLAWEDVRKSRIEVESQMVLGGLYEGYRYAYRLELENLFDSVWGGIEGNSTTNVDGVNWLVENLFPFGRSNFLSIAFGAGLECTSDENNTCVGYFHLANGQGHFSEELGLSYGENSTNTNNHNLKSYDYMAHALVRDTRSNAVSEPSTLAIFTLGIIGLASRRFNKQS